MDTAKAQAERPDPDLTGKELGDVRLLRKLGEGAMAEVYLGEQLSLKRQVAVKVLKSRLAADETYVRRFEREAQAAASLVHANIVQIHEVGQVGHHYYIVQEYVQGLNLRQWLARNGPPDLRTALLIMRQAAAALAKAAEQGIVHRDIKPENIMVTRSGEVKVADFGLARLIGEGKALELTEVGITLGTPLYMSPEQVEGRSLDHRSDIYSLGVTCYQMLAGEAPFTGDTALAVALQHLKKQPEPLENVRRDLPAGLCRLVHRMLAKSPEGRFQSARDLLRELRKIQAAFGDEEWPDDLAGCETEATALATHSEATQRLEVLMKTAPFAPVRTRTRRWMMGAAAAFLAGVAIALLRAPDPPLLAEADLQPVVPRQENVLRQWLFASQVGTLEAWQSVIDYFPDRLYWVYRAKQQLARIYLRERDLDRALAVFEELGSLDEAEGELKAFGLAGACTVLSMQGKYRESAHVFYQLTPALTKQLEPSMRQWLIYSLKRNREELGAGSAEELDARIGELLGPLDPPAPKG